VSTRKAKNKSFVALEKKTAGAGVSNFFTKAESCQNPFS
jgi:hypothetical protein